MRYEVRVTVELIDHRAPHCDGVTRYVQSTIIREEILLSGVTRKGELDPGFIGDIETELDEVVKVMT
jgi:hypothetical protein